MTSRMTSSCGCLYTTSIRLASPASTSSVQAMRAQTRPAALRTWRRSASCAFSVSTRSGSPCLPRLLTMFPPSSRGFATCNIVNLRLVPATRPSLEAMHRALAALHRRLSHRAGSLCTRLPPPLSRHPCRRLRLPPSLSPSGGLGRLILCQTTPTPLVPLLWPPPARLLWCAPFLCRALLPPCAALHRVTALEQRLWRLLVTLLVSQARSVSSPTRLRFLAPKGTTSSVSLSWWLSASMLSWSPISKTACARTRSVVTRHTCEPCSTARCARRLARPTRTP